jgi:LysM repeat protein
MFNIGNETKPEIEFTEIEGYNINGEKIEKSGNGLVMGVLALFLFGGVGFLGYNYLQDDSSPQKSAVMGVSRINPLNKSEIERGLNEIHQDMEARGEVNKKVATQSQSYKSKEEISDKLDGMVDMFYNKEAIPAELDNMVEDFYSNQPSTSNSRIITIREGDTLAKISKRFYGNSMEYQKIIDANQKLQKSATLHIGEKIRVPY